MAYVIIGEGGSATNYNSLANKPSINGVQLTGNKTLAELGAGVLFATEEDNTFAEICTAIDNNQPVVVKNADGQHILNLTKVVRNASDEITKLHFSSIFYENSSLVREEVTIETGNLWNDSSHVIALEDAGTTFATL